MINKTNWFVENNTNYLALVGCPAIGAAALIWDKDDEEWKYGIVTTMSEYDFDDDGSVIELDGDYTATIYTKEDRPINVGITCFDIDDIDPDDYI